jgi:hypothetical protein
LAAIVIAPAPVMVSVLLLVPLRLPKLLPDVMLKVTGLPEAPPVAE